MDWAIETRLKAVEGILAIANIKECALAVGETNKHGIMDMLSYGSLSNTKEKSDLEIISRAIGIVTELGLPREYSTSWGLG